MADLHIGRHFGRNIVLSHFCGRCLCKNSLDTSNSSGPKHTSSSSVPTRASHRHSHALSYLSARRKSFSADLDAQMLGSLRIRSSHRMGSLVSSLARTTPRRVARPNGSSGLAPIFWPVPANGCRLPIAPSLPPYLCDSSVGVWYFSAGNIEP